MRPHGIGKDYGLVKITEQRLLCSVKAHNFTY